MIGGQPLLQAIFAMLFLDLAWVSSVMKSRYSVAVRQVQGSAMVVRPGYAITAYVLLAVAVALVMWQTAGLSRRAAVAVAALWGALLYGVYAFTVLAIFKDFPVSTAVLDLVWGGVLFGLSVLAGRL